MFGCLLVLPLIFATMMGHFMMILIFNFAKINSLFTLIGVLAARKDLSFVATIGLPDLSCCLHIALCVSCFM